MNDKRIHLLRDEKISKAIVHMSIPAIIGLMVMGIYNFVDTMFVAWLGTKATGATQVVFPIMMLVSAFGLSFGMGGGSFVSRLMGMNKKDEANKVGTVAFYTVIIVGVLFTILAILGMEPLFGFFGASSEMMALTKDYGFYILLGSVFTMGNMTLNNLLRAEGSAKLSMIGMASGAILNMILDPIFIFVFGWGIQGAAIATTLSQVVSFVILFSRYVSHHSVVRIERKYFKPEWALYKEIFKVGIPTFLRQVLVSLSLGFMNQVAMEFGGSNLLAATGILFRVTMIPIYGIFGIGQGFQPVIGYNYGSKNKDRVVESVSFALKFSAGVALVSCLILVVFAKPILGVFRPETAVLDYGLQGMKYYATSIVFMGLTNIIGVFYQALGKGKESLILSVSRQGIFFIPALMILPGFLGIQGVLASQLVADVLTLILSGVFFIPYMTGKRLEEDLVLENS